MLLMQISFFCLVKFVFFKLKLDLHHENMLRLVTKADRGSSVKFCKGNKIMCVHTSIMSRYINHETGRAIYCISTRLCRHVFIMRECSKIFRPNNTYLVVRY